MSWFELWFEHYNPGAKGEMNTEFKGPSQRPGPIRVFLFLVAFSIVTAGIAFAFYAFRFHIGACVFLSFLWISYFIAAFFLRPKPNYSNMGWAGGMLDNPFRYSDDYNRTLFFLMIFLYPGRVLSFWIVDFVFLVYFLFRKKPKASDQWKKKRW